jgi:hypothetical protein
MATTGAVGSNAFGSGRETCGACQIRCSRTQFHFEDDSVGVTVHFGSDTNQRILKTWEHFEATYVKPIMQLIERHRFRAISSKNRRRAPNTSGLIICAEILWLQSKANTVAMVEID